MSSKISALTALVATDVDGSADVLPIYDASAGSDKKQTVNELAIAMGGKAGTEQTASGLAPMTFSSVPTWAKRIVISIVGASIQSSGSIYLRFIDTAGSYFSVLGANVNAAGTVQDIQAFGAATVGIALGTAAASVWESSIHIVLENPTSFVYSIRGFSSTSNAATDVQRFAGRIFSSHGLIDSITINSEQLWDAGVANVRYYR